MALFNTIEFLPPVFRSSTNQRFLGATLDQLVTDPVNVPLNGYVGRRFSPTYKINDNYVPELTKKRQNYQLEPGVVVKDDNKNILFNSGFVDLLDGIANNNGFSNNHQRLFPSTSYTYDGHFDYDKFVNYYNYYWLPNGPDSVPVVTNEVPYSKSFTVTRNTTNGGYIFTGAGTHANGQLTLARGGTYTFAINQPGIKFWIQSEPGISGQDPNIPTINTRQVFGVKNNGTSSGVITFNVPLPTAQNFYTQMPIVASVDAAVDFNYSDIQNRLLSDFLSEFPAGLDGIANPVALQNATFAFINNTIDATNWTTPTPTAGLIDDLLYPTLYPAGSIVPAAARPYGWRVNLAPTIDGLDYLIQIIPSLPVIKRQKIFIRSGKVYASNQFWVNDNLLFQTVPAVTATKDYLYYQDESDPTFYGQIKLVDNSSSIINVEKDILGKTGYTSPNGVVFTNGLKIRFDSFVTESYANKEFYVEGVGKSITLVLVEELFVPETFGLNMDTTADYITVNRASLDRNPWSRSNRWFHKDVVLAAATYNNTEADYGPNIAGRRPIIEFDANTQLFNFGYQAKASITYIVVESTDAFNDYEGKTEAYIDGIKLKTGDRVVFANDYDTTILNKIYKVVIERINATNYLTLVPTVDDPVLPGENVLVSSGQHAGETYRFDGTAWYQCQSKATANQAPYFDLVDSAGYSFSDSTMYPNSTFAGCRLFGYAISNGADDPLLGFPLKYQNFNNIGDIVFNNYYDTDTFTYTGQTTPVACNSGYMIQHPSLTGVERFNNWIETVEPLSPYQIFTKFYDGTVVTIDDVQHAFVQIDIAPTTSTTVPHLKVYLNNKLLVPGTEYDIVSYGVYVIVTLAANTVLELGDKIDVAILSNSVSQTAYYEVPKNLDYNPMNESFDTITLGQIRNHYNKLIENTAFTSTNNIPIQDHYIRAQGGTLLQHDAPLIYAMTFLNDPNVNFVNGLQLARKEYTKFKNKFLSLCSTMTSLDYKNPVTGVDQILKNINAVKNITFPWYYSDMVPQGSEYAVTTYTVLNVRQTNYEINSFFNNTVLSNRAVLVYVNGVQQRMGPDYVFSTLSPTVIFKKTLEINDVINIHDYANTDGNYIPETPTKLGLYPKSIPQIYVDTTYQTATEVLRGHDGSLTPTFGDFRDDYLLELELRIYNNIKTDYNKNHLSIFDVLPGRFRTTDYNIEEYNYILNQNFLTWAGVNSVDYISNKTFDANNPWTWNYSDYGDTVDNSKLQGSWRAIYKYWYDTDTPNLTPWEMLGFFDEPTWWADRYGPSPYTSGNFLLWEDLAAGYIWNGSDSASQIDSQFIRPGLTNFIPVDTAGNLLDPTKIPLTNITTLGQFNTAYSGSDFAVGEQGPVETAWRRSSDYPYAIQLTLALAKPAEYFATQLDTSRFFNSTITGQFTNSVNQRITPSILKVNGDATTGTVQRTSGYINWIADNIKNLGIDPIAKITDYFSNLSVQLSYKIGGFTDKNIVTVTAEQTTSKSISSSVIIPDSNYNVYLNKSIPVSTAVYSAVIVEKTQTGFAISGYDPTTPFFTIIPSIANNKKTPVAVNELTVNIYQENTGTTRLIPYGTEFATVQQVSDFLISYERFLVQQGFVFNYFDKDLNTQRDWTLSVRELLYWVQQGWTAGTIIVLNPTATNLRLQSRGAIVDEITNFSSGSKLLNQNFLPIKNNEFTILRTENAATQNIFNVSTLNGATIAYAKLNLVQYEHVLIFDNVDDFNDIIYIPNQGTRQYRLKLTGYKTGAWTGALSAPGYIYNSPVINEWSSSTDYRLGDLVKYNNFYYTATQNIAASTTFSSIQWTQIQQDSIQTGLLPNFGLNAQQFNNVYDIDIPPVNESLQNYSAGLIGFRQRQYLTDLGISVPTQTKFYQGYIKEKGSMNSINALTKASFNNVNGNISVYEEWAFRVGLYGGVNNNLYKEFILDQSVFTNNPVAFTSNSYYDAGNIIVVLNGNAMSTDISGNVNSNVYTSGNTLVNSAELYSNRIDENYIRDIPSAGYMNLQDVDYTIFDINQIDQAAIADIGAGDKVWVAKNANSNWEILRANETYITATALTYTLDSYGSLTFSGQHNFVAGDILILKSFNTSFDGAYKVESVPNSTSVVVLIDSTSAAPGEISPLQKLIRSLTISGNGVVYDLKSARVNTVTDLINKVPPLSDWIDNDRVWVDNAKDGWGVYTHTTPWRSNAISTISNRSVANGAFGSAIKINNTTNNIYIGNPGSANVQVFSNTASYVTTISNTHASFGSAIATQGNLLAIGAPRYSEVHLYVNYVHTQTLESAGGNTIAISGDQQWIYSGNTASSQVKAYTPGTVTYLNVGNLIAAGTLTLAVGDYVTQSNSLNYITANGTVAYSSTGNLVALRNVVGTFVANVGNVQLHGFGNTMIARNGVLKANANVAGTTTAIKYLLANTVTGTATSQFGSALITNHYGNVLIVGAPNANNTYSQNGNVYVYSRAGNAFNLTQTLSSQHKNQAAKFGTSIAVDSTLSNLCIGVPGSLASGEFNGLVERWTLNSGNYVFDQSIFHPRGDVGAFGTSLQISADAQLLAVGSQGSASGETTVFDNNYTVIDSTTTRFIDYIFNSGTVYLFEPLVDPLVVNGRGKYTYMQELQAPVNSGDNFGFAVDLDRNTIAVGAPGAASAAGMAFIGKNPTGSKSWVLSRQQQARVDIGSISRTFIYNKSNNNILAALDYIDPNKGKVLNAAAQDIDYQLTTDPALYNHGTGSTTADLYWSLAQVGKIWWDLSTIRYIDYEQDALIYRLNHWGEQFPNSSVDVYQWVESRVLPSQYTGPGTPLYADDSRYSTYGYVDSNKAIQVKYYFWVKNIDIAATSAGKNNSVISITSAIESPQTQGIPYAAALRNDTVALYNINDTLIGQNSVVHLGSTDGKINLIHSEYALVQEGNPYSTIPQSILNKFADSLAGVDIVDNPVPDLALPPSQRYGTNIRPRQTMIIYRLAALNNYLNLVNQYLLTYPVVALKVLTTLNSSEPIPTVDSNQFNLTVDTADELVYINPASMTSNVTNVLVTTDSTQSGKWAIYQFTGVNANNVPQYILTTVQSYKTNLYWDYADYYAYDLYDPTNAPEIVVANQLELGKLELVAGQHIKVENNGNNQFEVYMVNDALELVLVGIENGTIQISTGDIPGKELRQILLAIQENIFIDDIAAEYNTIFFSMIKYILTEQKNLDWVFKTSFISATQAIRKLKQFPAYIPDNQNFYLNYINEVKPYRTVVREFVVDYIGEDYYNGDVTDFDLPAYYDANLSMYRSPSGEQIYDDTIRSQGVYTQWNRNYKYKVTSVTIETPGYGYVAPPKIVISGGGGSGATAYSVLDNRGGVGHIVLTNPGSGYTSTPTVTINGSGAGASASAVLQNVYDGNNAGHNLVRSIETTIKLDRINYTNPNTFVFWDTVTNTSAPIVGNTIVVLNNNLFRLDISNWIANTDVSIGTLVATPDTIPPTPKNTYKVIGNVYSSVFSSILGNLTLNSPANLTHSNIAYTIDSAVTLPITNLVQIDAASFDNANDRIRSTHPTLDLKNVGGGIDYPGVIVDGNTYIGNYNDTNIRSMYSDSLGVNPSDIIIDGGEYVGRYSSHAPEELVPGRMYDALDMTIFDTNQLGIRIFKSMNLQESHFRIAGANTTVLSANLDLTDGNIYVTDASVLPDANVEFAIPGIVTINGERITYYVRDLENNRLGQLRRSVDGTSTSYVHVAGTRVVDSSSQQSLPTYIYPYTTTANTAFKVTDPNSITYVLRLTGNISANIGDNLIQYDTTNTFITSIMQVAGTFTDSKLVPIRVLDGSVSGIPELFDDSLGFDSQGAAEYRIGSPTAPTQRISTIIPTWTPYYSYTSNSTTYYGYPSGSTIYYNGNIYEIVGNSLAVANTYAATFDSITTNDGRVTPVYDWSANVEASQFATLANVDIGSIISPDATTFYVTTGNVFDAGGTFANVSSNVIPYFSNVLYEFTGSASTSNPLQIGDQWWETGTNSLYRWAGSAWVPYTPPFPGRGFDNSTPPVILESPPGSGNYVSTGTYVISAYIVGRINASGIVYVDERTTIDSGNVWYSLGVNQPADGLGLVNSTTAAANFIKASRSFNVPPGTTP